MTCVEKERRRATKVTPAARLRRLSYRVKGRKEMRLTDGVNSETTGPAGTDGDRGAAALNQDRVAVASPVTYGVAVRQL